MNIEQYIRAIPDYPKPGILFRDITPLMANPTAFEFTIQKMSDFIDSHKIDALVAIESRGFIFAAPIAYKLSLPLIPVRKPGKLPYKTHSVEYALEYGSGSLDIHQDALQPGMRVAMIDDLLATGGTAAAAAALIDRLEAKTVCCSFVIELQALNGRKLLPDLEIESLLKY